MFSKSLSHRKKNYNNKKNKKKWWIKKMEVVVKAPVKVVKEDKTQTTKQFWKEFGKGYLEVEKMKKKELLKEYQEAYENMEDKNSFNAQYLETLIFNLKH